jgi:hypothetical protein
MDELQKTIVRWCSDDKGKNVLYKRNGMERYPGFKLYKMISRNVHHHTPEEQLRFPFFSQFELSAKTVKKYASTFHPKHSGEEGDLGHLSPPPSWFISIDQIPSYVA